MYAAARECGLTVFIHSCGQVAELFPDLIEIGVECFNPFQPEVMDVYELKRRYGEKLSFYGGLSTQRLLPYGTPAEVRAEVRRLREEIGSGGGYVLAPAHDVPGDVPPENILAVWEEMQSS
jgi:uroporphyrinogen decarboxylase